MVCLGIQQDALRARLAAGNTGSDSLTANVLAAMMQEFPPDWTQLRFWPRPSGGFWAAVPLGSDQQPVSFSHAQIAVVRTLVVELGASGEVVNGQLVEFVGADGLDPGRFDDHVRDWQAGDFGSAKVLVAEYSIAYAGEQAQLYEDSTLTSVGLSLERRITTGKAQFSEWFCWVTDYTRGGDVCPEYGGVPN